MGKKKYIMTTIVQMSPHQEHSIAREEEVWLEEVEDCPASECDGEECECPEDKFIDKITRDYPPTETDEPNESLEEKIQEYISRQDCLGRCTDEGIIAQIAKEHYQSHPNEVIDCVPLEKIIKARDKVKDMVSLDEVLRKIKELKNEGS